MSEMRVGVRELKARLSEYLRQVKAGDVLVITERGKPIGRILPAEQSLEDRIRDLAAAGLVRWNGEKLAPFKPLVVNRGDVQVSDLVVEDRDIDYLP
jgi:prevent-host-death family protein